MVLTEAPNWLPDAALARSYVRVAHATLVESPDSQSAYGTLDRALLDYAHALSRIVEEWPRGSQNPELLATVMNAEREMGLMDPRQSNLIDL